MYIMLDVSELIYLWEKVIYFIFFFFGCLSAYECEDRHVLGDLLSSQS